MTREVPTIEEPVVVPPLSNQERDELSEEVRGLAAERGAVMLAHNYQLPEIQDLADFTGDSLGLSRRAAAADADLIVFCGVHFMAETASILAPEKTVLIPDPKAGCSVADSITAAELRNWKRRHPGAVVVMYVNTSAEVKAESDYCCTSSNAVQVVEHIVGERGENVEILFGPDMWLGQHAERVTGRRMTLWPGECHVHAGISEEDVDRALHEHPGSELLVHPECPSAMRFAERGAAGEISEGGVHIASTGGMLECVRQHPERDFIVATETGMLHPLQKAASGANLAAANEKAVCKYMKMITLPKLRDSLRDAKFRVKVPDEVADRARVPIERMVAIG
jgi:quinolinate synthase